MPQINHAHLAAAIREVVQLAWSQADRGVRRRLITAVLLISFAAGMTALGPLTLKLAVDEFTTASHAARFHFIAIWIGLYVFSQWCARVAGDLRGLVYARAERGLMRVLNERLFAHVMALPLSFHVERKTGALSQVMQNGQAGYQLVLHTLIFTILPVVAELGTTAFVLLRIQQPTFVWIFGSAVTCYAFVYWRAAGKVSAAIMKASGSQVAANATIIDSVLNYETIKYFTAESVILERVRRYLIQAQEHWVSFSRQFAIWGIGIATIYAVFLAIALGYAAYGVVTGQMTVGTFVLIGTYMLQVVRPVEMLGSALQSLSQGTGFLRDAVSLFRESPETDKGCCSRTIHLGTVDFERVSLTYGTGRTVLRDITIHLPAGKTLGVVGTSGAGKSTLVRLITRLIEPTCGKILFDGIPAEMIPLRELRRAVAVVPQDTILFDDTIHYNIAFGKADSTSDEVQQAAKLARLNEFIAGLPCQYETTVGERGVKLSGGEKQRIAIARAAIKRPTIYIFDEATSSLDTATEREILQNLIDVSKRKTTIVIAHRLSAVVHADEIVVLEQGRIVERGSHLDLLKLDRSYARLWRAQHPDIGSPEVVSAAERSAI